MSFYKPLNKREMIHDSNHDRVNPDGGQSAYIRVRVGCNAMENAGIMAGDILVAERAFTELNNRIVIAVLNGEKLLRRYEKKGCRISLVPATHALSPIDIDTCNCNFSVVGVVKYIVKEIKYD